MTVVKKRIGLRERSEIELAFDSQVKGREMVGGKLTFDETGEKRVVR